MAAVTGMAVVVAGTAGITKRRAGSPDPAAFRVNDSQGQETAPNDADPNGCNLNQTVLAGAKSRHSRFFRDRLVPVLDYRFVEKQKDPGVGPGSF